MRRWSQLTFCSSCEPEYFAEIDFISPPNAEAHSFTLQVEIQDYKGRNLETYPANLMISTMARFTKRLTEWIQIVNFLILYNGVIKVQSETNKNVLTLTAGCFGASLQPQLRRYSELRKVRKNTHSTHGPCPVQPAFCLISDAQCLLGLRSHCGYVSPPPGK